jgi:serralysin
VVWNTDSNGNFTSGETGVTPGDPPALWTINTNGVTSLVQVGNNYELEAVSTGTGPLIELNGSAVTAGQFPTGWAPVGAEKTASGYEVAWSVLGANEYVVWNTDSNGDYTSNALGVASGQNFSLEDLNPAFART